MNNFTKRKTVYSVLLIIGALIMSVGALSAQNGILINNSFQNLDGVRLENPSNPGTCALRIEEGGAENGGNALFVDARCGGATYWNTQVWFVLKQTAVQGATYRLKFRVKAIANPPAQLEYEYKNFGGGYSPENYFYYNPSLEWQEVVKDHTPPTAAGWEGFCLNFGSANQTTYLVSDVKFFAPYGLSVLEDAVKFNDASVGYAQPAAKTVTVINNGYQANTLASVSQPVNFEVSALSTSTLSTDGSTATFTVRPKAGLPAGEYTEDITISGSNSTSTKISVSFKVVDGELPPVPPVAKAASNITHNSFTANWEATGSATDYLLSVYVKEAGSGSEIVSVLSEDFASIATGVNNGAGQAATAWSGNDNFPTVVSAWQSGGAVRIGGAAGPGQPGVANAIDGSITSKALDLSGGPVNVKFKVKGWATVEGNLSVKIDNGTAQPVSYTAVASGSFEEKTLTFPAATAASKVTFAITGSGDRRVYLDDIEILVDKTTFNKVYILEDVSTGNVTSHAVSGSLTPETTYYYTVKAKENNKISDSSNEITLKTIKYTSINGEIIDAVSVYPTLTSGKVIVMTPAGNTTIKVSDLTGKQMILTKSNSAKTEIALDNLSAGIYFVSVETNGATSVHKVVKK